MTCRHCGATADIHRYETQQCPAGGVEQSRDNYLATTYEEDSTALPVTRRVAKLEKMVADLRVQLKGAGTMERRMRQLEGWQSDLAVRLVNLDRKLAKKPPVRLRKPKPKPKPKPKKKGGRR